MELAHGFCMRLALSAPVHARFAIVSQRHETPEKPNALTVKNKMVFRLNKMHILFKQKAHFVQASQNLRRTRKLRLRFSHLHKHEKSEPERGLLRFAFKIVGICRRQSIFISN